MPPDTPPVAPRRRWALWAVLAVLWAGAVTAGLATLAAYDNAAGTAASAPPRWPVPSRLALDRDRPTLVMLAHPRCSCTQASVGELAELMARAPKRPKAYVVFVKPGRAGASTAWERTDLWDRAAGIPDVTVVGDDDRHEAGLFGAETSGQTFLYAPDGALLFSGGTTGARGHAGDNAGRATLLALLRHEIASRRTTPVFGCSLFAAGDRAPDAHAHEPAHAHPDAN
ncbi:MAG: RedB protein [Vicinamibacteraceae bacterium]